MIYYTMDGREYNFNIDKEKSIGGRQGNIHILDNNVCLKEYKEEVKPNSIFEDIGSKFNQEMFDYFKDNYRDSNMGELYDLLYDKKLSVIVGYTMKCYQEMVDNILDMPVDYILDNFSLIYDLVLRLTDDCVRIVDLHYGNIINTDNGMIIIDYDKYYIDKDSTGDTIGYINKSALMSTFIGIFKKNLERLGIDTNNKEIQYKINSLFTIGTTPLVLKYRLRNYNSSLDYIINSK